MRAGATLAASNNDDGRSASGNSFARHRDEGPIWLAHDQRRDVAPATARRSVSVVRQAPARGRRQLRRVFRLVEESEIVGPGAVERRNVGDAPLARRTLRQRRAGQLRDLARASERARG